MAALPFSTNSQDYESRLRDEFAKVALAALITGRSWPAAPSDVTIEAWGKGAYAVADACMKARKPI